MKTKSIILALAISASSNLIIAQDAPPPRPPGGDRPQGDRPPGEGRPGGQGGQGFRPVSPIIEALDINKDGTIDADELAKAAESLKKLDKNGDGKITEEEFRPQRPSGQGGPGGEGRQPGAPGAAPGGRGEGRPQGAPGGGQPAPGGEGRPQRPELEK